MTGGMTVSRNAGHAAVAEKIVLAVDQLQHMAKIEIRPVVGIAPDLFGIGSRFPFAPLHHELRVRHVRVAAGMIEMQMRID
jgi:hypothetical protein